MANHTTHHRRKSLLGKEVLSSFNHNHLVWLIEKDWGNSHINQAHDTTSNSKLAKTIVCRSQRVTSNAKFVWVNEIAQQPTQKKAPHSETRPQLTGLVAYLNLADSGMKTIENGELLIFGRRPSRFTKEHLENVNSLISGVLCSMRIDFLDVFIEDSDLLNELIIEIKKDLKFEASCALDIIAVTKLKKITERQNILSNLVKVRISKTEWLQSKLAEETLKSNRIQTQRLVRLISSEDNKKQKNKRALIARLFSPKLDD